MVAVARKLLIALWRFLNGGLSLERCAVLYHTSPMALYCLVCAIGHHRLVTVLTQCGLPLPVYFLADEHTAAAWQEKCTSFGQKLKHLLVWEFGDILRNSLRGSRHLLLAM